MHERSCTLLVLLILALNLQVVPGETALAFYTAFNPTDKPITGVSTYNVSPMRAGLYFNKIQCFCFEEQRLKPHEEIDMPVRGGAGMPTCSRVLFASAERVAAPLRAWNMKLLHLWWVYPYPELHC